MPESTLSPIRGLRIWPQREGMGLLEYQAMPSLRDIAHGFFSSPTEFPLFPLHVLKVRTLQESDGKLCR